VENYPGFPEGILGPELMEKMKEQAKRFGAEMVSENVTEVDFSSSPFKVKAGDREEEAKTVIIATGAHAKRLGLPSEEALFGKGVSACATCDGYFFKDKSVAVVGGGDAAMEEAIFLTRFATDVRILVRSDSLKASKIMAERARNNEKISFHYKVEVEEVLGVDEGKVTGLKLKGEGSKEMPQLEVQGLFVAIGHAPNTEIFNDQLELAKGYIVTKEDSMATSVPGVYACGDVQDWKWRQAITAAGSGCQAALEAQRFLEEGNG
jgi:thioredoxin reductase (NADPH)